MLNVILEGLIANDKVRDVMEEIITQSKVEFNYVEGGSLDDAATSSLDELEDATDSLEE